MNLGLDLDVSFNALTSALKLGQKIHIGVLLVGLVKTPVVYDYALLVFLQHFL